MIRFIASLQGMKVTIFKNGEAHDIGTTIVVSRRQFKHWITFLDHLSRKLNMLAPVHKIFTTDGLPIRQVIHIFHLSFRKILRENISIESEKNEMLINEQKKKSPLLKHIKSIATLNKGDKWERGLSAYVARPSSNLLKNFSSKYYLSNI
uniref:Doublecortin domain-containing protein n=1 Tax=Ascaris lumbricoides TaxID=6252 RepID=A0A0M3HHW8_ASCLU